MTRPDALASIQASDCRVELFLQPDSAERRSKVRFPLDLRVRYRTLGRGDPFLGLGWVVNMSSSGMLITYQHEITVGARMELSIEWPYLLDGCVPLQLVTRGKVVRCEMSGFVVVYGPHEFRTTGSAVTPIDVFCRDARKRTAKSLET